MKKRALELIRTMENERREIVAFCDNFTEAQLKIRESQDTWSMAQVMLHVVTSERLALLDIKRKVSNKDQFKNAGFGSWLRSRILRLALYLPLKFKAPQRADVTNMEADYGKVKSDWDKVRAELLEIIENCDDATIRKELFKHPRAGNLNLYQSLEFIRAHMLHHKMQIKRLSANLPKTD